ncbi:hypothetical protein EIK77_000770 [Talaromyces pinophilus]|nr:hypothetical protein EIK77_000770 [Talaromyces pinophilus]
MCGLYMLQYLDKTALSYASSMGIKTDTHMSASEYSWTGSIFYIGYLVFEYPHNRLMQMFPLGKYISISVILWGMILSATAGTSNPTGVLVVRFFLGGFEGAVTAGFVLVTSQWYPMKDQGTRSAIWFSFNGVSQIVGGVLAYGVYTGFEKGHYTFPAWKAMFLITGLLTAVYGMFMFLFMADSPVTASWLTDAEKHIAVERLPKRIQNRMFCAVIGQLFGLLGMALMMGLSRSGTTAYPVGQLVGYYLDIGNSATALTLVLSIISSNTAGYTKKTTVNAISLIGYCVGFLIGPQTYRKAPDYPDAKWTTVAMWTTAAGCCLALYFVNKRENDRRDKLAADLPPQPEGQEFLDLTDKENMYFRYTL